MASFHPHHPLDTPAPDTRTHNARLMKLASVLSVGVAGLLIVIKLVAWVKTDSLSLLSSLVDSLLDVASSLVIFVAVRYSLQPPDAEHRFGHGKAEDVASFAQAAFITGSALFIGFEAIGRFLNPRPIEHSTIGIAVMAVSILLT
ncbi:MAG: cation diffusion facilitator family transporter, partial [Alphaproteobacteria bacterium]|nr:cation diffusion facilitator family transporter [Alphaproteobacteria bacterium]